VPDKFIQCIVTTNIFRSRKAALERRINQQRVITAVKFLGLRVVDR